MITLHDLEEAIAECQGERNPNANTCIKLAAFYTIKERLYPESVDQQSNRSNAIAIGNVIRDNESEYSTKGGYSSDTEFMRLADEMDVDSVFEIIDELMTVLEATNPRLYRGVLRKMSDWA